MPAMDAYEPIHPAALRSHYSAFLRPGRILLTGHSHQAWPDAARAGQLEAFDDAAAFADDKWGRATEAADAVRGAVAARIGARAEDVALGGSTHELVTRFLSALDLRARRHLVTTAGEFHSLARQLARLEEAGVEVTRVAVDPLETLGERLAAAVRRDTAALLASTVLFRTSAIVPGLPAAVRVAREAGAEVLLDAYHAFNVVPFTVADYGDDVFVTAGGYKYAQWGEGCCWLRVPPESALRPVYTGWYADRAGLEHLRSGGPVAYGRTGADRFSGSTYDPTSHYRARAVIRFFDAQRLTVPRLRALSLRQTARLRAALDGFDFATPADDARRGGFLAIRLRDAARAVAALRARDVFADARGDLLRLGPAPYVTDDELDAAAARLRDVAARLGKE
jgi:kynureninase